MFGRRSRRERVRRTRRATLLRLLPMVAVTSLVAALLVVVAVSAPRVEDATPEPAEVDKSEFTVTPSQERPEYTPEDAALVAEVDPSVETIQDGVVVAELEPHELDFELLGVTWSDGVPIDSTEVQVRWQQDGQWSPWTILEAQSQTSEGTTPGTDPKWVGPSQAAQARVVASQDVDPQGLTLVTVSGGEDPVLTPAASVVGQPPIITRAQWGARAYGGSGCGAAPANGSFSGTIVHHTAGSNTYTAAQSAGIVKSTQAYHMNGQGWCDIGYNFLIDKYGQIFEGRAGGITRTPYGAHAGNSKVNANTTGISLMGEFTSVAPTEAMKDAAVRLTAWRHSLFGVSAKGGYSIGGVYIQRIDGHRSVKATACPGQQVFNWLPTMRDRVATTLAGAPPSVGGFADVPATHAFAEAIAWLSSSGISTGYVNGGSTTFRGSDAVLREQMGAFLYRFQGKPATSPPGTSPFVDLATSHAFYREITWLASTKITTGYGSPATGVSFQGTGPVLREQMAAFLYRLATLRSGGRAPVVALPATSPFADVPTSHPFYKEIVWLSQQGISTGYTEANGRSSFRGSQPVLREQMAAFLHRLNNLTSFSDVSASHSFRGQIEWMVYSAIAPSGVTSAAKSFSAATAVGRGEMATYLYRIQASPAFTAPPASPFSDVATTDPAYREMAWLRASGISTGYDDGGSLSFRPGESVLREQVAAFLYRLATIRAGGRQPVVNLPATSPFADVPTSHPFYKQIVWLSQSGITTGYVESDGSTTFRGSQSVLHEQMAAFLHRFQGLPR